MLSTFYLCLSYIIPVFYLSYNDHFLIIILVNEFEGICCSHFEKSNYNSNLLFSGYHFSLLKVAYVVNRCSEWIWNETDPQTQLNREEKRISHRWNDYRKEKSGLNTHRPLQMLKEKKRWNAVITRVILNRSVCKRSLYVYILHPKIQMTTLEIKANVTSFL